MSRIGKLPISIPSSVKVEVNSDIITMKSDKGELSVTKRPEVSVKIKDNEILVARADDSKEARSLHGLTRTLINNMLIGLTEGYKKSLEIVGVGYKVEVKGKKIVFNLGYSHPIYFYPPDGITVSTESATKFSVAGYDKELVGEVAAKLRSFRKPEPYKGKGIKYSDEVIIRKAGKTGKK